MRVRRLLLAAVVLSGALMVASVVDRIVVAQTPAPQTPGAQAAQQMVNGYLPAPNRRTDEGRGPFPTLTIRGVMLIDGTGAPPAGPMDIVIANNRIQAIRGGGTPGV